MADERLRAYLQEHLDEHVENLAEWIRHGYWSNRYERHARRFVALRLPALQRLLKDRGNALHL